MGIFSGNSRQLPKISDCSKWFVLQSGRFLPGLYVLIGERRAEKAENGEVHGIL